MCQTFLGQLVVAGLQSRSPKRQGRWQLLPPQPARAKPLQFFFCGGLERAGSKLAVELADDLCGKGGASISPELDRVKGSFG